MSRGTEDETELYGFELRGPTLLAGVVPERYRVLLNEFTRSISRETALAFVLPQEHHVPLAITSGIGGESGTGWRLPQDSGESGLRFSDKAELIGSGPELALALPVQGLGALAPASLRALASGPTGDLHVVREQFVMLGVALTNDSGPSYEVMDLVESIPPPPALSEPCKNVRIDLYRSMIGPEGPRPIPLARPRAASSAVTR